VTRSTGLRLKDDIAGDLFLSGCGELACSLLEGGVVDEVNLWIHPAVGAAGTRPFDGTTLSLELLDVAGYDSGVVLQRYDPGPDVATSDALGLPSEPGTSSETSTGIALFPRPRRARGMTRPCSASKEALSFH